MPSGRPCDPSRSSNQQAADCNRQQREEGGGQQTQKRKKKKGEESRRQYLWQVDGPNAMVEAAHACSLEAATATGGWWWWWWWWCSGGGGESSMEHVGYVQPLLPQSLDFNLQLPCAAERRQRHAQPRSPPAACPFVKLFQVFFKILNFKGQRAKTKTHTHPKD